VRVRVCVCVCLCVIDSCHMCESTHGTREKASHFTRMNESCHAYGDGEAAGPAAQDSMLCVYICVCVCVCVCVNRY